MAQALWNLCKGTALPSGRRNFALWLFVICIILSSLTAWTAVVCLLQDKWASFSNLCTNDVPQSNFSNFQTAGLRLCAGHFCSENDSPFSLITGCISTGDFFLPIKYLSELFICQWFNFTGLPCQELMEITCTVQCIWDQIPGATLGCFQEHPGLNKREQGKRRIRGRGLLLPGWNSGYWRCEALLDEGEGFAGEYLGAAGPWLSHPVLGRSLLSGAVCAHEGCEPKPWHIPRESSWDAHTEPWACHWQTQLPVWS